MRVCVCVCVIYDSQDVGKTIHGSEYSFRINAKMTRVRRYKTAFASSKKEREMFASFSSARHSLGYRC